MNQRVMRVLKITEHVRDYWKIYELRKSKHSPSEGANEQ